MGKVVSGRYSGACEGFSLIELVVTITVFLTVMGATALTMVSSQQNFSDLANDLKMRDAGRRAMQRITEILPTADQSSLLPGVIDDAPAVAFRSIVGHDGTSNILGALVAIGHVPVPGEVLDGADNNGDGRADEGSLVYIPAGGTPIVIAADVVGVRFSSTGAGMAFEIDVASRGPKGIQKRSFSGAITFRGGN